MNSVKISILLLFFLVNISFAGSVNEGPFFLKGKHYNLGKNELSDGGSIGENSDIRFWVKSNFGENMSNSKLNEIAKDSAHEINKISKTHLAGKWFWQTIKDNQYLIIGYSDSTNSQYSYAIVKKRYNDWIYRCSGDKYWSKVDNGDTASCHLKKGYDTIKFQFHNPKKRRRWDKNDILYRFAIYNR